MAERNAGTRHLILYDGDCGFCGRAVTLVPPRDSRRAFRYDSLHSEEGERVRADRALPTGEPDSLLVVPAARSENLAVLQKSAAVLFIVGHMDWPWRLLSIAGLLPDRLLDWAYDVVARNRHLLGRKTLSCPVPAMDSGEALAGGAGSSTRDRVQGRPPGSAGRP